MFGIFNRSKSYADLSSAEFMEEMNDKESVVLDVRSPGEFASGHLKGARNVNVQDRNFSAQVEKLNPTKHYLVYCRSGMRSASACNYLSNQGFTKVSNLRGGIMSWKGEVV